MYCVMTHIAAVISSDRIVNDVILANGAVFVCNRGRRGLQNLRMDGSLLVFIFTSPILSVDS